MSNCFFNILRVEYREKLLITTSQTTKYEIQKDPRLQFWLTLISLEIDVEPLITGCLLIPEG